MRERDDVAGSGNGESRYRIRYFVGSGIERPRPNRRTLSGNLGDDRGRVRAATITGSANRNDVVVVAGGHDRASCSDAYVCEFAKAIRDRNSIGPLERPIAMQLSDERGSVAAVD